MNILKNILDRTPLDNKLLTSFCAMALTRAALDVLLGDSADKRLTVGVPLAVGGVVGYLTHNDGSVLRRADQEDGNPVVPSNEAVPAEAEAVV